MAANDYHVIVYQILAYLYECLKDGKEVNEKAIEQYKADLMLNDKYWSYILRHLVEGGLVEGVKPIPIMGRREKTFKFTSETAITPYGISFLIEDSMMEKAKKAIKDSAMSVATSVISSYFS